jgi:ADP-heptose:LPS heptosyltransferase
VRVPRPVSADPARVFVLSRITLGADIAVTSVLLDAAKHRFPKAKIFFVGPRKNYDLFAADPRLTHAPLNYRRAARLETWRDLAALPGATDLVLDPDSRLTQLGLLPVGMESRCHLFESRAYGAETDHPLPRLASDWCVETLGVPGVPYVCLAPATGDLPTERVAVSLGVGENPAKRIPDPFESQLLQLLGPAVVDCGASLEESARVQQAARGTAATLFQGPFADFARIIARSHFYVGYDSAGQHAAAALGIPLICIFAGFPVPRMFHRWRPVAPNATVIRVDDPDPAATLELVRRAL